MKKILFILLPIIIFGAPTYVYFYLRQEQDKIIRKNKYDEAWNEVPKKGKKKKIWGIHFVAYLVSYLDNKSNSAIISIGLGLLSCIAFILSKTTMYSVVTSYIGLFAAILGLSIGAFGALQIKNESSAMKYGGVLLSIIGLGNIYFCFDTFQWLPSYIIFFIFYGLSGDD